MQIKIPNYNSETKFFTRYYFTVIFVCQFQKLDVTFEKKKVLSRKKVSWNVGKDKQTIFQRLSVYSVWEIY